MRKKMRVGKAKIGWHAEHERSTTDFKSTSSPVVAPTATVDTSETAGINC